MATFKVHIALRPGPPEGEDDPGWRNATSAPVSVAYVDFDAAGMGFVVIFDWSVCSRKSVRRKRSRSESGVILCFVRYDSGVESRQKKKNMRRCCRWSGL